MIEDKSIFNEVQNNISMMCRDDCIGADLAASVSVAIEHKMRSVCVSPDNVVEVWPWLEKTNIKIISRFYVDEPITDDFMSDFSGRVSAAFHNGANGAIIFMSMHDLQKFIAEISSVRTDLFFNKTFNLGLDISEIGVFDWDGLFRLLHFIRADSLVLTFEKDTGDKSDFVGRVFAMLNASRGDWTGTVNFVLGQNAIRIDQVYRLIQQVKPETLSKTEFFIDND